MFGLPTVLFYAIVAIGFVLIVKLVSVLFKNSSLGSFLIGILIFLAMLWLINKGFLHIL